MKVAVSKKQRFEVFKRDRFTCVYCGNQPPDCVLELEHIKPRSKGGSDDYSNLATSCFACNRGKAARLLDSGDCDNVAILQLETIAQLTAMNKMLVDSVAAQEDIADKAVGHLLKVWDWCPEQMLPDRRASLKSFLKLLNYAEVCDAADVATKRHSEYARWKYFCGVCWTKIKRAAEQ